MSFPRYVASLPISACLVAISVAQVEDLGGPERAFSTALAVSADGSVVGGFFIPLVSAHPFVWTRSASFTPLDVPGGTYGSVTDLSDDGSLAVGNGEPYTAALLWDVATGVAVSSPPVLHPYPILSGDGSVVFGTYIVGSVTHRFFRWRPGGAIFDLGVPGATHAGIAGASQDGSVLVGTITNSADAWRSFRWTQPAGVQSLTGLGATSIKATGVSSDGTVIAGIYTSPGSPARSFRWTVGAGMQDLGTLGSNAIYQVLLSADGQVVTGCTLSGERFRAFRWAQATGMVAVDPSRSFLPEGISGDGSVIVGASYVGGFPRGALRWTTSRGLEELLGLDGESNIAWDVSLDGSTTVGISRRPNFGFRHCVRWTDSGEIGESYCSPAVPNSTGASGLITLRGSNVTGSGALTLEASHLPPSVVGYFMFSRNRGLTTPMQHTQGRLCLGDPMDRLTLPGQTQITDANGMMSFTLDPSIIHVGQGFTVPMYGETFHFQAWHRDLPMPGSVSNLTNGASVRLF